MRNVILRVSGTFGSGKTTAVRQFLAYGAKALMSGEKIAGYRTTAPTLRTPIYVIGKYDNVCGGTDAIKTQAEVAQRILKAHPLGHVLYEGALVSASGLGGQITQAVHPTGCAVYAFMNTPLELCIERVKQRRLTAGNEKPLDPKNLIQKFNAVVNCYRNFRAAGYDVRLIDYADPHPQLMTIFEEFEA